MRWLRRRAAPFVLLAFVGVCGDSCIGRTLPIPPPGVTAQAFSACDPAACPNGGVIVTLGGTSDPGALILVEDTTTHFLDGRRFTVSTWASNGATGDGGVDAGTVQGMWSVQMGPQPDPMGGVVAPQHGDTIEVTQFVRNSDGLYQQSTSSDVAVP